MFSFPGFQSHKQSALEAELSSLRREVSRLSRKAGQYGADTYHDTRRGSHELYGELVDVFSAMLPVARRRTHDAERLVRDNPAATAAIVGLIVVGLAASIIYSRR